jgi:poly(3-hydroxybutyrate) depolymerase
MRTPVLRAAESAAAGVGNGTRAVEPAPVVLALHGAAMDGSMMVWFSGLNKKSDEAGFIVLYGSVRDRQGDWLIRSSNCGFANRR